MRWCSRQGSHTDRITGPERRPDIGIDLRSCIGIQILIYFINVQRPVIVPSPAMIGLHRLSCLPDMMNFIHRVVSAKGVDVHATGPSGEAQFDFKGTKPSSLVA